MRRGGFTLIEMMLALSISAVMLAAVVGLLASVWTIAKESSDELQSALRARNIREQLFYSLADETGKQLGYGLVSATNIVYADARNITAYPPVETNEIWKVDASDSIDHAHYAIDADRIYPSDDFPRKEDPFARLYLKVEFVKKDKKTGNVLPGSAIYYDRLIVPKFGWHEKIDEENLKKAIGGMGWQDNP